MKKNGTKKEILIRSINFGKAGEPSRELVEIYERQCGTGKLSKLVREAIVRELSKHKEFDGYKVNALKQERKNIFSEIKLCQERLLINRNKLEGLGVNENDID